MEQTQTDQAFTSIHLRMPDKLLGDLDALAARTGETRSVIIRSATRWYVSECERLARNPGAISPYGDA